MYKNLLTFVGIYLVFIPILVSADTSGICAEQLPTGSFGFPVGVASGDQQLAQQFTTSHICKVTSLEDPIYITLNSPADLVVSIWEGAGNTDLLDCQHTPLFFGLGDFHETSVTGLDNCIDNLYLLPFNSYSYSYGSDNDDSNYAAWPYIETDFEYGNGYDENWAEIPDVAFNFRVNGVMDSFSGATSESTVYQNDAFNFEWQFSEIQNTQWDYAYVQIHIGQDSACSVPVDNDGSPVVWSGHWSDDPDAVGENMEVRIAFSNANDVEEDGCFSDQQQSFRVADNINVVEGSDPQAVFGGEATSTEDQTQQNFANAIALFLGGVFLMLYIFKKSS